MIDGLTVWEIIEKLDNEGYSSDEFFEWMRGQTHGIRGDGQEIYWQSDFDYWLQCKKERRKPIVRD